ncbi:FGGY-family carbohydrate kinase [Methylovirgula sp. 4M-Z18]|uniref:FGGY-family carbohydrate kinase n=1 Tax=Methylovirgula sp. 4M-Z18 TaxID=2293567 RepID=UPI000E2F5A76|nr:FGGY family carbohydrate kinase [Methylovirgula sp. 4M-Z18]RFB79034.1 carbohydrate kinase [Methylovirgula sp. 4M-Z18]
MTGTTSKRRPVAVFDLGKTNSKMFVFAPDGSILDERRTKPAWISYKGRQVLDDQKLFTWMQQELAAAVSRHDVGSVMVSAHGCTFALVRGESELMHPVLDYEQEIPDTIAATFETVVPDYSEAFTPRLPLGLCYGRHVYWMAQEEPELFAATEAILGYSQYWVWRFSGRRLSEYSYLGVHCHLWAPFKRTYSSLVDRLGWRGKFPQIMPSGAIIGSTSLDLPDGTRQTIDVHNGVHDTNAAFSYYRMTGLQDFTLVSTGTWVVVINPDCPLSALDAERDMLCNVTVEGMAAPSLRFMGGRENDLIGRGWSEQISRNAVEAVIARGVFALPSWEAGGPFPEIKGTIVGGEVSGEERAALAALYVTMMTDLALDLIHSTNKIVVDGGLTKIALFTTMLAQLRPKQTVLCSTASEGTAKGAAALAFHALGLSPFKDETLHVAGSTLQGLEAYRDTWRELSNAARRQARTACSEGTE